MAKINIYALLNADEVVERDSVNFVNTVHLIWPWPLMCVQQYWSFGADHMTAKTAYPKTYKWNKRAEVLYHPPP